jgi:hypothetical protein
MAKEFFCCNFYRSGHQSKTSHAISGEEAKLESTFIRGKTKHQSKIKID